jgi:hypothetical protein
MNQGRYSRPFVELRGSYGLFALRNGWFNLYYAGDRPDWMDVGQLVSVYVIGPNGGLMQDTDYESRTWGDETFAGEVFRIERLRIVDLDPRHLMSGVQSTSSRGALLKSLRRRGLNVVIQDPVEVVSIRRVSYALKDIIGPLSMDSANRE